MRKTLLSFLTPPIFANDENKNRSARYTHWITLVIMAAIVVYETIAKFIIIGPFYLDSLDSILAGLFIVLIVVLGLLRYGRVRLAGAVFVVSFWTTTNTAAFFGFGVRDSAYLANFIAILAAGLLLGGQAAVVFAVLSILTGIGLAYAEMLNISPIAYYITSPSLVVQDMAVILAIYAVLIFLLISGLDNAIKSAQTGTKELEVANRELKDTQVRLEENRNELLIANEQLKRRTERINTISDMSKTIASIQGQDKLFNAINNSISQRLGYYHVGIFLLDKQGQFAILRASNSEGGSKMLSRGHRLKVGEQGIVGFVTRNGQPHIVLDTGKEAFFFNNTDLPDTRSELALPLKARGNIIGALDIQSTEPGAFTEDDVSTLSILADQVAIAIENAQLFEQTQRSLRETEIASQRASGKAWEGYSKTIRTRGYRYDGVKSEALKEASSPGEEKDTLSIPVQLRGQTIGRLKLKTPDSSHQWTDDELAIIEATAERTAIALEGARLLDDAQKRATRETFLSDVSSKLSASFQLDSILRDTVEELGQTLKGSTVSFQLVNPSAPVNTEDPGSNGAGKAAGRKKAD